MQGGAWYTNNTHTLTITVEIVGVEAAGQGLRLLIDGVTFDTGSVEVWTAGGSRLGIQLGAYGAVAKEKRDV